MVTAGELLTPELLTRLREVTNKLAEQARSRFHEAIVPIYGSKENGRPVHIGSAILLDINDTKVLLTAAHVVDNNDFTTLYLGGGAELDPLRGEFSITQAPLGRDRDRYDFAFTAISQDIAGKIKGRFIGLTEIAQSRREDQGRYYTALGYPNSKNRKYNPKKKTIKSRLFPYSSIHKIDPDIASKLPGNGAYHIFMTYDKRSRDEHGLVVNSTAPKGMSGGAVIDAGRPADREVFFDNEMPAPLLAGVVIELKKKKVLLAVRIEIILPELLAAFPQNENPGPPVLTLSRS